MSIAAASDFEIAPAPARPLLTPLMLAIACVGLADWLFYGWQIGISLALFLGVLGVVAMNSWQAFGAKLLAKSDRPGTATVLDDCVGGLCIAPVDAEATAENGSRH